LDAGQAKALAAALLRWFRHHGRHDLPWQRDPTPYRVWLSEVMLQQTQVATAIPYFEGFTRRFPDVASLAAASLNEVLRLWAGLGYYARARHLHAAARRVMQAHGGSFPHGLEALTALPGVGRSTAGAVLALGFGRRAPILDGNVKRVLCRYFALPGWPGSPVMLRQLWDLAEALTPPATQVAAYTQAIMDLGATVCTRRQPRCAACPWSAGCAARAAGRQADLPASRPRATVRERAVCMLLLRDAHGRVLLQRRPESGLWGGLWSLPEAADAHSARRWCQSQLGAAPARWRRGVALRHAFTHYTLRITPLHGRITAAAARLPLRWHDPHRPPPGGLPAPVARLLAPLGK
jgi:A/G-specific adenine glycosylase